jgi:hypothetical protein
VKLVINSTPPGAEVFRLADGVRIGKTPFEQSILRTDGEAVYLLKLTGFHDERLTLPADRNTERTVTLARVHTTTHPQAEVHPKGKRRVQDGVLDPFND